MSSPESQSFGSDGGSPPPPQGKSKGKGWDKGKGKFEGKGPPGKYGPPGGEYGYGPPGAYGKGDYGGKGDPWSKGGDYKGKGGPPYGGKGGPGSPYGKGGSFDASQQQAAQQQPKEAPKPEVKLVGSAWPNYVICFIELLKYMDWLTEIFKIFLNHKAASGAGVMGWVIFTLIMGTLILLMRVVDQVALLVRAAKWEFGKKCCLAVLMAPISIVLMPFHWATWSLYDQRNLGVDHLKVFRQRPLGTVFIGLPGYNIVSQLLLDKSLVMHPAQAHLRSAQSIWQTFLEDIPCMIIDMIVIQTAPEGEDTFMFLISFVYSCALTLILIGYAVREVDFTERNLEIMADNKKNLPALTNK